MLCLSSTLDVMVMRVLHQVTACRFLYYFGPWISGTQSAEVPGHQFMRPFSTGASGNQYDSFTITYVYILFNGSKVIILSGLVGYSRHCRKPSSLKIGQVFGLKPFQTFEKYIKEVHCSPYMQSYTIKCFCMLHFSFIGIFFEKLFQRSPSSSFEFEGELLFELWKWLPFSTTLLDAPDAFLYKPREWLIVFLYSSVYALRDSDCEKFFNFILSWFLEFYLNSCSIETSFPTFDFSNNLNMVLFSFITFITLVLRIACIFLDIHYLIGLARFFFDSWFRNLLHRRSCAIMAFNSLHSYPLFRSFTLTCVVIKMSIV